MSFTGFLIMRHELLLTLVTLLVVIIDLAVGENRKNAVIGSAIALFGFTTIAGFLPMEEGSLFGGMYNSAPMLVAMKNILNVAMLIVLLQSVTWLKKEANRNKVSEFFVLLFATLLGMDFMISAGDFLMFYIGLELATLPATALAAFDKSRNASAEAGIKFIFSSALSSGVLLLGLSILYGTTGSIYFSQVFSALNGNSLQLLGFIFFLSGMGFKISLVPFHFWTADVYEGSPVNITAYLSVISKGAAVFVLTVMLYKVFSNLKDTWEILLYVLSITTMTIANLFAIRQQNLKRFIAFSSIAQAGFILLGIMGADGAGLTSVVYFLLIYVFTNLAAFGVITTISNETGNETIPSYRGLYRTNPLLSLTMMLALFSLAGIPPVAGFFGKFFLFTAAASRGYYILVLIAVLNVTVSLYYYLGVIRAMFIDSNDTPVPYFKSDIFTRISLAICVLGVFLTGFFGFIYEYIYRIT